MHKATRISSGEYEYRGGLITKWDRVTGSRSDWEWRFGGAHGFCVSMKKAQAAIDAIVQAARKQIEAESGICPAGHLCRHGIQD